MIIEKEKLRIRQANKDDAKILSQWWNDGKVMAHAGFPNGLGTSAEKVAESLKKDDDLNRRLIIEFEDLPIGEMSYRTPLEAVAEIGIKICNSDYQDKKLGSQYLQLLIETLFNQVAYQKIILDTNLKNERAQHVYEKLGFRKLLTKMNAWQDQLGEWQSSVDYEMTAAEFIRLYKKKSA